MWQLYILSTVFVMSFGAQYLSPCKDQQLKRPKFFPHRGYLALIFGLEETDQVELTLTGCQVDTCKIVNARNGNVETISPNTFVISLSEDGKRRLVDTKKRMWTQIKSKYEASMKTIASRERKLETLQSSKKQSKRLSNIFRRIHFSKRRIEKKLKKGAMGLKLMQSVNVMVKSSNKSLGVDTISFSGVPCQPPPTYTQRPSFIRPMPSFRGRRLQIGGLAQNTGRQRSNTKTWQPYTGVQRLLRGRLFGGRQWQIPQIRRSDGGFHNPGSDATTVKTSKKQIKRNDESIDDADEDDAYLNNGTNIE